MASRPITSLDYPGLYIQDNRYRYRFEIPHRLRPYFDGKGAIIGTLDTMPVHVAGKLANQFQAIAEFAPIRHAHRQKIARLKGLPVVALLRDHLDGADYDRQIDMIESALPVMPDKERSAIHRLGGAEKFLDAWSMMHLRKYTLENTTVVEPSPSEFRNMTEEEFRAYKKTMANREAVAKSVKDAETKLLPVFETVGLETPKDTLSTVAQAWIDANNRHQSTKDNLHAMTRKLVECIGDLPIKEVTLRQVQTFVDKVAQLPSANRLPRDMRTAPFETLLSYGVAHPEISKVQISTINQYAAMVRAFFSWCYNRDHTEINLTRGITKRKDNRGDSEKRRRFSTDEMQRIIGAANEQWKPGTERHTLLMTLIYTGARLREPCGLRKCDVKQDQHGVVWVDFRHNNAVRRLKNNPSERTIPLHSDIGAAVLAQTEKAKDATALIFPGYAPKIAERLSHQFRRLCETHAKIDYQNENVALHSCRHSWEGRAVAIEMPDRVRHQLIGERAPGRQGIYDSGAENVQLVKWVERMAPI